MTAIHPDESTPAAVGYGSYEQLMAQGASALHGFLASKIEAALGRPIARMEIRFRNLSLSADTLVLTDNDDQIELPTLPNELKHKLAKFRVKKNEVRKPILKNFNGVFRPGTMTLILGQPSSGKSALLKVLSGRFQIKKNIHLEGEITYNGIKRQELIKKLPQLVTYVTQRDHHFPTLTVKETLEFAHACCGGGMAKAMEPHLVHGTPEQNRDAVEAVRAMMKFFPSIVIQHLGLENCQNTIVGNAMVRGVSGGERKRVTTGEMEFGQLYASLMDEISTGLDSAATHDIVHSLQSVARNLHKTIVISLLQPSPSVFELFDDIMMLNEGEVMYHGPREQVVGYFASLGFACLPHRDVADYLMDLGTSNQEQYQVKLLADDQVHPKTPSEFAEAFRRSTIHQTTLRYLDEPVPANLVQDAQMIRTKPEFHQSIGQSTWTVLTREMTITFRNKSFIMGRVAMVVVMGLLYSTVYYRFDPTNVQVVMGVLFAAVMFISMGQASQIATFMDAREIFYKQRAANFYRTSSYVIASAISRIPMGIAETLVFGPLIYWICGFVKRFDHFVIYEGILLLSNMTFGSVFFFLSAIAPDLHVAKPLSMVTVLFLVISMGFIISHDNMPSYFVWIYWINPIAWSFRALAVNQYMNDELNVEEYGGIHYQDLYGKRMGQYYLELYGVPSEHKWVPLGFVILAMCYLVFGLLSYLMFEHLRYEQVEGTVTGKKKAKPVVGMDTTSPAAASVAIPIQKQSSRRKNFVPVTLAFDHLRYSVPKPSNHNETIELLKGVSGYALPGTMTALMGSSGAGKTTLMDVIAGRKSGGTIQGKILLNGHEATKLAVQRSTGYCEQMDIHSEAATIREALTFSAFLRQSDQVSDAIKIESVEECLELLDLDPIADKIIRGSSVEQMKRLTIGVELAAQPSVLFLDEPTSGLDARSAKLIMDGVRKVANTGRTIVCTIHQPSAEVFSLFDNLLLLKRGGETVFFGPLGEQSCKLVEFFEQVPGVAKMPTGYNPATWMLEVIGAGVGNALATQGKDFVRIFHESENKKHLEQTLAREGVTKPMPGVPALTFKSKRAAGPLVQGRFLFLRFFRMYWRTASYNLTRFFITIFLALLFGLVYANADFKRFSGINSGIGMIFLTTVFLGVVSMNSILPLSCEERPAFYRERAAETYNAFWYFLASTVVEIPYVFASCLVFTSILFPMVGFTGINTFVNYWLEISLHVLLMTFFGQLLSFATPSVEVAAIGGVLVNSATMLFAGFSPPASAIPKAYKWLYQIVPQRYTMSFLVSLVFANCPTPGGSELGCQNLRDAPGPLLNAPLHKYIETVFNMHYDHLWRDFGITIAFIVALRVLALLALQLLCFQKR